MYRLTVFLAMPVCWTILLIGTPARYKDRIWLISKMVIIGFGRPLLRLPMILDLRRFMQFPFFLERGSVFVV